MNGEIPTVPARVAEAFGVSGHVDAPIPGGQGTTRRMGHLALKPCDDSVQAEWLGGILEAVTESGFRIARPMRSGSGKFVVDGWSATWWIEGTPAIGGRWIEAIATCDAFGRAVRHVPFSDCLARADNPYVRIDSALWADVPLADPRLGPVADRLRQRLKPVTLPGQVVHGDPGEGNLLFAPHLPIGIIDVAPYWHPADYTIAMLVADGIAWSGAPLALLEEVRHRPEMDQLLARAVLFRLHVGLCFGGQSRGQARLAAYAPVIAAIEQWESLSS